MPAPLSYPPAALPLRPSPPLLIHRSLPSCCALAAAHPLPRLAALPCCSYMWMTPMFLFVLPIFSLCNTNDCSWGTRDAHAVSAQPEVKARMDRNAREFRSRIV